VTGPCEIQNIEQVIPMAAEDLFSSFVEKLNEKERLKLAEELRIRRGDLLAARSEDARLRIVSEFLEEVHELLNESPR
jgi:hypothetical protein